MTAKEFPPDIAFNSTRLAFQRFCPEDISDDYLSWINDPEVNRYSRRRNSHTSVQDARNFMNECGNTSCIMKILHKGTHIGNLQLGPIDWSNQSGELRIVVGRKDYWSGGFGSEALAAGTCFLFSVLGLCRIEANSCNPAFIRCMYKLGWVQEGVLRERFIDIDGNRLDYLWFGVLKREWARFPYMNLS